MSELGVQSSHPSAWSVIARWRPRHRRTGGDDAATPHRLPPRRGSELAVDSAGRVVTRRPSLQRYLHDDADRAVLEERQRLRRFVLADGVEIRDQRPLPETALTGCLVGLTAGFQHGLHAGRRRCHCHARALPTRLATLRPQTEHPCGTTHEPQLLRSAQLLTQAARRDYARFENWT